MSSTRHYQVHFKENLYFNIKLAVSIIFYAGITVLLSISARRFVGFIPIVTYFAIYALFFFFRHGILIGFLKGNAIRVSENQFPETYELARNQSAKLGLSKTPAIYILQAGGLLNAFATRFLGSDFVIIYSDVLETAYESGNKALEFIVAHELGHIKRKHITKRFWLFPSFFVPFLNSAYSRACEYTCDRIGYSLCPDGSIAGMLILAGGKRLYSKINVEEFLLTSQQESGFWKWFAEIISSHPNLPKRIAEFKKKSNRNMA